MKKLLLVIIAITISSISSTAYAQWATIGGNLITGTNVGIGTEKPETKLDVVGSIKIPIDYYIGTALTNSFSYNGLKMGHYALSWMRDTSWYPDGPTLWQSGYGGVKFFTAGRYRMGITAEGNIGIGTEKPESKLDVIGDIKIPIGRTIGTALTDAFSHNGLKMGHYALSWMTDSWSSIGPTLWQSGFGGIKFFTSCLNRMSIDGDGNIGIGVQNPTNKLEVAGVIRAEEIKIEAKPWADFVFHDDYKLRSLDDVKAHIDEHKHLPDIPSEADIKEKGGVGLGEMQVKLLQKIEELTLYVIKQDKEIRELKEILSNK